MTFAESVTVQHEGWAFVGLVVTTLGATVIAWIQNRKTRRENFDQHAAGAEERRLLHEQLLARLAHQDDIRGEQVDGIHTAIGHVEGKVDAHIADARAHRKEEP